MEIVLTAAQTLGTGLIGAWLALGVRDNILYPSVNETYTAAVFEMARMKEEYPDEYAHVAHRAITDRGLQKWAFRIVVLAELLTTLVLFAGVTALLMALLGVGSIATGRIVAMIGAMMFTAIWAGFLIVGNHFCYWLCHEGAQNTHYQMTLWGLGTMILVGLGAT